MSQGARTGAEIKSLDLLRQQTCMTILSLEKRCPFRRDSSTALVTAMEESIKPNHEFNHQFFFMSSKSPLTVTRKSWEICVKVRQFLW